jgi:hypothetical protein
VSQYFAIDAVAASSSRRAWRRTQSSKKVRPTRARVAQRHLGRDDAGEPDEQPLLGQLRHQHPEAAAL